MTARDPGGGLGGPWRRLAALLAAALLVGSCAYSKMASRRALTGDSPPLSRLKTAYPEDCALAYGTLSAAASLEAVAYAVVAVSSEVEPNEIVESYLTTRPQYYSLLLPSCCASRTAA